jgi:hypothetical protein
VFPVMGLYISLLPCAIKAVVLQHACFIGNGIEGSRVLIMEAGVDPGRDVESEL